MRGFAGELRDPSGLIYLRARWYDAGSGRLVSRSLASYATDQVCWAGIPPAALPSGSTKLTRRPAPS